MSRFMWYKCIDDFFNELINNWRRNGFDQILLKFVLNAKLVKNNLIGDILHLLN